MSRIIYNGFINGESKSLKELGLEGKKIKEVWTVYDEDKMWDSNKFNPMTGQPIEKGVDLEGIVLTHEEGVLIEDIVHDWRVSGDVFKYYSRYVPLGKPANILFVFE